MQTGRLLLLILAIIGSKTAVSQNDPVILEYINTYKELAISEMQRTGVPASIKLAQGIHETTAGTSVLVKKSNNHFGIKCKSDWTGASVKHTDDAPNECFRKYNSPIDSYKDHSDFLKKSQRYASLFTLDPADYTAWAHGLKKAGYATNPKYPQVLIRLIEDYHLQDYTFIAMGKMEASKEVLAKTDATSPVKEEIKPGVVFNGSSAEEKPLIVTVPPALTYPDGEFKINETRVIFARQGTPYLSIAQQYQLPLARIFEFNDMKPQEAVDKDQLIYIQRKRKTGNSETHTVREGETLFDIAQVQAIRIESLMEYNYLKPGMQPASGTVLYLKTKAPAMLGTR